MAAQKKNKTHKTTLNKLNYCVTTCEFVQNFSAKDMREKLPTCDCEFKIGQAYRTLLHNVPLLGYIKSG